MHIKVNENSKITFPKVLGGITKIKIADEGRVLMQTGEAVINNKKKTFPERHLKLYYLDRGQSYTLEITSKIGRIINCYFKQMAIWQFGMKDFLSFFGIVELMVNLLAKYR